MNGLQNATEATTTENGADVSPPKEETAEKTPIECGDLEDALALMTRKADEAQEKLLRLAAEFENFKKRIERETNNALKFAEENILKELLPSLDNLERALQQGEETNDAASLIAGVKMTQDGLLSSLEKFGLQPLASLGEPFDPHFHEALSTEASDSIAENHVLREYQKGYMFKDRLIRAAKVIVSRKTA